MLIVDWAREAWIQITWVFTRGAYCFNNVDAFDNCRPFWATLMFGVIGVGVLVLLPDPVRQLKRSRCFVELAKQLCRRDERVLRLGPLGPRCRLSRPPCGITEDVSFDEGEDLTALRVHPQHSGRAAEADCVEVLQERVHRRCPRTSGSVNTPARP